MRIVKRFTQAVIVFSICTSLIACDDSKVINREVKIGVTLYKQDDTFISSIGKNLVEVAREKELEDNYKITLNFQDAKGSLINQYNQVDNFISQGYDVICVNIVDRTAASIIIDKAKAGNIPIIFFNREPVEEDMNRWDKLYYVGSDANESGKMQAEIIIDAYNKNKEAVDKNGDGKIQYVLLEGEQGHQDSLIRTEYCIRTIVESGIELEKLADDTANWELSQGSAKMAQWIKEFGDEIEVVFSNNDDMALGALYALNNSNVADKPLIVGIDGINEALQAVKNGSMAGTIISDSKMQAKGILDIAYNLVKGKSFDNVDGLNGKYIRTSHTAVTLDNAELYK